MSKFNKGDYRKETRIDECVVPIIRTNGYGSGYAELAPKRHQVVLRCDHRLAKAVLTGDRESFSVRLDVINQIIGESYKTDEIVRKFDELTVEWLPENEPFYIKEYDGYESVITKSRMMQTRLYPVDDFGGCQFNDWKAPQQQPKKVSA